MAEMHDEGFSMDNKPESEQNLDSTSSLARDRLTEAGAQESASQSTPSASEGLDETTRASAGETQLVDAAETQYLGADETLLTPGNHMAQAPLPVMGTPEEVAADNFEPQGGEDDEAFQALKALQERRAQKRKAAFIKGGIAAGAVAAVVGGFFLFNALAKPKQAEATYQTAIVERDDFTISVQGSGSLQPASQVVVTPEVDGIVDMVNVTEGQYVKEGDVLFTLRSSELDKAISDAEAELKKAQDAVNRANDELAKAENARNVARQNHDNAQAAFDQATAQAQSAYDSAYQNAYNQSKADSGNAIPEAEKAVADAREAANTAQEAYAQAVSERDAAQNAWDADPSATNLKKLEDAKKVVDEKNGELGNRQSELASRESELATLREGIEARAAEAGRAAGEAAKAQIAIPEVPIYDETSYEGTVESAREGVRTAESTRDTAQKALDEARTKGENRTVKAPKAGTLISLSAQVGAAVGSTVGATDSGSRSSGSLATIADVSSMRVSLQVNEVDITSVKTGQRAKVTFSSIPGLEQEARVVDVASVSSSSGDGSGSGVSSFTVDLVISKPDGRLKPGMTATVTIYTTDLPNVLQVENGAILELSDGASVDVITNVEELATNENATPKTERQKVKVGPKSSSKTVIESGLTEGDVLLVGGSAMGDAGALAGLSEADLASLSPEEIAALDSAAAEQGASSSSAAAV